MPNAPKQFRLNEVATSDQRRENSHQRGYTRRWSKARKIFLAAHPLCQECESLGVIEAAFVVDHVVPHRGNEELFWDQRNWQALCETCHNAKTARGE